MEFTPEKKKKLALWIIGVVAVCILIFLGVQNIDVVMGSVSWCMGLISPLILGFAFALVLNVPMRFFERHFWPAAKKKLLQKLRKPLAYIASFVLIVGILAGIIWLIIPELVEAITLIIQTILDYILKTHLIIIIIYY